MDILKFNSLASDRMAHKPHIDYLDDKIDSLEIPDAQVQSDWEETDEDSKAYIKNKPTITEQVQSDWEETDEASKAFVKNKPTIPDEQVQSDWNETDEDSKDYIKNKPTITEQVQSDWEETDEASKAFVKNKPTIPDEQVQSDWNETDEDSKDYIKNKPTIPEATILYHAVGEEDDGAITPQAVRKELYADEATSRVQIGNGANATGDLSTAIGYVAKTAKNYSIAIGNHTIASGDYTTALGNGANATHAHSVALGSNSKTTRGDTVAVNYGTLNRIIEGVKDPEQPQDAVTKNYGDSNYVSLTEPNHVLGETTFDTLHFSSDTEKTPLEFDAAWTVNSHYVKMTNGILSIYIDGARPKVDGMTGQSYYTVARLPSSFRDIVNAHDIQFVWSSMNGGILRYSGKVEKSTGNIILYLAPETDKLVTIHRFSIYITYVPV